MKDTKDQILLAAFELFLNNNYESVTFTALCKATKLTKGAVYHYFSSKEELFKAVIQKFVISSHRTVKPENLMLDELIEFKLGQIQRRMQSSIMSKFGTYESAPMNYIQILSLSYKYYPDFAKIGETVMVEEIAIWKNAINLSIERNKIRNDFDVGIMTYNFISIITNLVLRLIHTEKINHYEIIKQQLNEMYNILKK